MSPRDDEPPFSDEDEADDDNVIVLPGLAQPEDDEDEASDEAAGAAFAPDGPLAPPPPHLLVGAVEALLLSADGPIGIGEIDGWLAGPGASAVRDCLETIRGRLARADSGFHLVEVAKGWQLRTDVRYAAWVAAMRGARPLKLSKAALEVLAIVAYRQPVTRSEIDDLRGVDSGGVLRMLCERGMAVVTGRRDEPGRPLIYGTSADFLSIFGLRDLSDLPTLRDLRELQRDDGRDGLGDTDDDELWGTHGPRGGAPGVFPSPFQQPLPLPRGDADRPTFGLPDEPPAPLVGLPLPPDPDD